jgi:NAD(P)-dependent dehydrogenase (short-subunit alcohol dehydrogenase family)
MTDASNSPRWALVTGGSLGIGRAAAEALLEEGWNVAICARSEGPLAKAARAIESRFPGRLLSRPVDVRSQEAIEELVGWVESEGGPIDCLINNAGIGVFGAVDELTGDEWRRVIETNLSGAFYALNAVASRMRPRGRGWIVNIASLASRNPFPGGAAYNASKFGLLGLSDAAMLDLRPHGIRVTAILPGSVHTAFAGSSGHPGGGGEDWKLQAEDVARAIVDLLRYPARALPSRLELRPSQPPKR